LDRRPNLQQMATCDLCGKEENLPYNCGQCGGTFCSDHRLPENHDCPGLQQWNDPDGVFDSGFDDSVQNQGGSSRSITDRLGVDTGPGGPLGYFRGNMTFVFLALMWLTFAVQMVVRLITPPTGQLGMFIGESGLYRALFTLDPANPLYVWTWITSIFSHGGFGHIAMNSIVIYFFGRLVEQYVGSRDFAALFIGSGILAGLGQMAIGLALGDAAPALGASGAALAIMGVLTVLNPNLKVYLYFILPMPIWLLTGLFAAYSVFAAGTGFAPGIGHFAHLIGLAIGLVYGNHVKESIRTPNQIQLGGGGPGGPGRGPGGPGRGRF